MPKIYGGPRETKHISRKATQNGFRAFDFAIDTQQRFNLYIVINLRETVAASSSTIFQAVRHKFRDWLNNRYRRSGLPPRQPAYLVSFENPGDTNPHVNWALHLPDAFTAEFLEKLPNWARKAQRVLPSPFDIEAQRVKPGTEKRLAKYVLKGTDPEFIDHFHMRELFEAHGPQGTVFGPRLVVSRSLTASSREKAAWKPPKRRTRRPV